jgi:hypothetical protein
MEKELLNWIYDYDSPDKLLVIYYAGHGVYDKALKILEISPYIYLEAQRAHTSS